MAEVITFDDFENLELSMEGEDVLVIKVDLSRVTGTVKSGKDRYATTGGNKPLIAGTRKIKFTGTVYAA